jgi:hypothetical protein
MRTESKYLAALTFIAAAFTYFYVAVMPLHQVRADLGSPSTFLGTSSNVGNAYTVTAPNVASLNDLKYTPIFFFPSASNVAGSSVTLTVNTPAASPIITNGTVNKQTTGGITGLVPGDLQLGRLVELIYDGTQFDCHSCLHETTPAGTIRDYAGPTIPAGYVKADGTAYSRTTLSVLFNAITIPVSANTTNTNTSVVVPNSALFQVGWFVGGTNITCNSQINSIPDGTHIVLNNPATGGATGNALTIGPYPLGDCSTTFNVPNLTGRTTAGVDGSTNITATTCTNPGTLGSNCGAQTQTLQLTQLPTGITSTGTVSVAGTLSGTSAGAVTVNAISVGAHVAESNTPWSGAVVSGSGGCGGACNSATNSSGTISDATTFPAPGATFSGGSASVNGTLTGSNTLTSNNTSGQAHPILMPVSLMTKIIKT